MTTKLVTAPSDALLKSISKCTSDLGCSFSFILGEFLAFVPLLAFVSLHCFFKEFITLRIDLRQVCESLFTDKADFMIVLEIRKVELVRIVGNIEI